jgi:hypothetical protein
MDRVYVGPRWRWTYVLADHGTVTMGPQHTVTHLPPDAAIYVDTTGRDRARAALDAGSGDE